MKKSITNPMDDLFKQHFDQSTTAVVRADDLWAAIQEERKPTKRTFVWWYLVLGALLLGMGAYYLQSVETAQIVEPIATSKIASPSKMIEPIAKKQTTAPVEINENKVEKQISNKNTFTKTKKAIKNNYVNPIISTDIKPINNTEKNNLTNPNSLTTSKLNKSKSVETIKSSTNERLEKKLGDSNLPTLKLRQREAFDNIVALEILPLMRLESVPPIVNRRKGKKWDKCQVRQRGALFVNTYGQAALAMENLTMTDNNASDELLDYKAAWEEKITPFVSYMGGLQLGYNFSWNGYISAGVAYQHFQTKYENIQTVTERITVFDEMAYFYVDTNGETVWVADSVVQTNVYDRKQTFANNHKLWHIPLQLGYTVDANQLRLGANIEALINISKKYNGYFLQENGSVIELDANNEKDFMSSNIGLSVSLGLHAGYRLGEHWEVYLSPRFRLNNQSYLNSDQSLKLSNHFAGLRAGLQYHF